MKHPKRLTLVLAAGLFSIGAVGVALSDSDDDDDDHGKHGKRGGWIESRADIAPVNHPIYAEECGACHIAYQPGLLPARSWARIMDPAALADHYGDDASLSDAPRNEISAYLSGNAADQATRSRSRAFAFDSGANANGQGGALPRISETRYFMKEHDEIPARLVTGNPGVGRFSQCNACHRGADQGVYNESQINIPGHGPWED